MQTSLTSTHAKATRQYFFLILLGPVFLLTSWTLLKFTFEDRLAGRNGAGYSGFATGPAPDLLFIGSSHTRQSYDVAEVEQETGRSAYLLSYGSLDLNFMDLILKKVLADPRLRPKVLILEAYSAKLAREPAIGDPRFFFDAPPRMKLGIIQNYLHFHPDLSSWLDIFDLVVNRGTEQIFTFPLNSRILAGMSYKGSYRGHSIQGLTQSEFQSLQADIPSGQANPAQVEALADIIRLSRKYGVELVMAESPMPEPISSMPQIQSLKRVFREEASANHIPYLDGDQIFPISTPALFADESHLSTAGRSLYTREMVDRFSAQLSNGQQMARHQTPVLSDPADPSRQQNGVSLYRR